MVTIGVDSHKRTHTLVAINDVGKKLAELRRENRRLREDVEILKRATAFFASM